MAESRLDTAALYAALDAQRNALDLSWRQVAQAAGVGPSTLTRLAQSKRPDVDSFAALVQWLGLPAEQFLRTPPGATAPTPAAEPAAAISSLLRARQDVSPEVAAALEDVIRATMRLVEPWKNS